ncbi:MAG: hypothetical protein K1X51_11460 [Rhodospirillaceae bacterium]|nr:hypothetical protein [Rhodospirillaceae bacterium]
MSRTAPLRRILNALLMVAMLAVGTLAADRATAHAAVAAVQPPCHRMHHADGLAQAPANPCDTVCAGSAPESSYDALPARIEPPVMAAVVVSTVPVAVPRATPSPAVRYGHGPPLPAFLRDRRLLI